MIRPKALPIALLALFFWLAATSGAVAQEKAEAVADPPTVVVKRVWIEPEAPGPATLCRLFVELENTGEKTASLFAFQVALNGRHLPVYSKELFAFPLGSGETDTLRLFNFWTSETGRPAPADGVLRVEARLDEATWIDIEIKENEETWDPVGAIEGLPTSAELTVKLKPVEKKGS